MNKKLKIFLLILSFFSFFWLLSPDKLLAEENKFGIHILEPSDLNRAAELVNSSGGDWGYITVVIRDDDLNLDKWQDFMNQCREKHLVPLVRIATHLEGENWVKPNFVDTPKWVDFLNQLNWPVKDQYVIIFNEPNHSKEWGGEINPKEYAHILLEFISKLKTQNAKFKILNAGIDLAAPNSKTTMEAYKFMQEMNWEIPGIFEQLDGWVSHSYPNHGYLGKPWEAGKTSVRGYQWELNILKNSFNLKKDLPVFITETGWPKSMLNIKKKNEKRKYYDENTVSSYIKQAFENVWLKDNRVKAVTPFVLNYPDTLFDEFSWLDKNGLPYPQYETIKNLAKNCWWPEQEEKFVLEKISLPPFLLTDSLFKGEVSVTNDGQSILGEKEKLIFKKIKADREIYVSDLELNAGQMIKPSKKAILNFEIQTGTQAGEFIFSWEGLEEQKITVLKPTFITKAGLTLWQKIFSRLKFCKYFLIAR